MALAGLLSYPPACPVHLQGAEGPFCPFFALLVCPCFAWVCLSHFLPCLHVCTDNKRGPLWWVALWCVVSPFEGLKLKDRERVGLPAIYSYILGGGLYPAGRGACDIVQVGEVCGLGAGLAVVYCRGVFLLHISGGLECYKNRAGGRFNSQPLGGSPCHSKKVATVGYYLISVALLLCHLLPTLVVRAGLVGAGCLVGLENGFTVGEGVHF